MILLNRCLVIIGAIFTAIGTIIGLGALVLGYENIGRSLIMFAPIGMLMIFTGLTVLLLHGPKPHAHQGKIPD